MEELPYGSSVDGHGAQASGSGPDDQSGGQVTVRANMDDAHTDTYTMVEQYICYCLEKEGITFNTGQRDQTVNKDQEALRAMGDAMYKDQKDTITRLEVLLKLTDGLEKLNTTMEELFKEGEVNWGRIVSLLVFVGRLAVRYAKENRDDTLLTSTVGCVSNFLTTNEKVRSWFASNNQWQGIVDFAGQNPTPASNSSSLTGVVLGAAAGLLGLIAFLLCETAWLRV